MERTFGQVSLSYSSAEDSRCGRRSLGQRHRARHPPAMQIGGRVYGSQFRRIFVLSRAARLDTLRLSNNYVTDPNSQTNA